MDEVFLKIYGGVQGVGFRYHLLRQALELELRGWVRNVSDGSVEAVAQGEKGNLESLVSWAQAGPNSADVEKVEVQWRRPKEQYPHFEIRK